MANLLNETRFEEHITKMLANGILYNERKSANFDIETLCDKEMLERFLTQYDIPVSADEREKDSLRRMANRWFEKAMILPNDRLNFNSEFLHHVSEEEIEKEKRRRKRMKVKGGLKKI